MSPATSGGVGWVFIATPHKLTVAVLKLAIMTYTGTALSWQPRHCCENSWHYRSSEKQHRSPHRKHHNFLLRTPFSVILDFTESLFRGLSNPAENKPQDQQVQVLF